MESLIKNLGIILGITVVRYLLVAGAFFYIFYKWLKPRFVAAKIQARYANYKDFIREFGHSLISCLIFSTIGCILLFTPVIEHTLIYKNASDYSYWWIPVSVALSLIIHDTYFYWLHRLLHHKRIFRLAHLVHHKSTNPSPWASYSFHVLESIAEGGVLVVLAFVLPMHPVAIFLFILIGLIINVYGHLGYEIMPEWIRNSRLFEVINTSVHHNLHHSKFKGNYGLYFRVWDRLCNTEHRDYVKEYDRVQQQRFGKKDEAKSNMFQTSVPAHTNAVPLNPTGSISKFN